jgi:endonuclease/exonuclease/phosphatase (EEP) superfamily protein YafD
VSRSKTTSPTGPRAGLSGLPPPEASRFEGGGVTGRGRTVTILRYAIAGLATLLGGLTVVGLFDGLSPYLELATFFRLQYAVLLAAAALAAILLRRPRMALAAALLVGVNLLVVSRGVNAAPTAAAHSNGLRVLLANVEYGNRDYVALGRLIEEVDPDVIGLTELTPAWADSLQSTLAGYPIRRLEPQEGAYGIGLYSRVPLAESRIARFPADGPPSVVATIPLGEDRLALVLTHVHTPFAGGIHDRQLQSLAAERSRLGDRLAVCGDFNSVPWSHGLRTLADDADLRSIHGAYGLSGTWPAGARILRVPIDNCLVSDGVAVVDRWVGPDIGSDHLPLVVDLAPADP